MKVSSREWRRNSSQQFGAFPGLSDDITRVEIDFTMIHPLHPAPHYGLELWKSAVREVVSISSSMARSTIRNQRRDVGWWHSELELYLIYLCETIEHAV